MLNEFQRSILGQQGLVISQFTLEYLIRNSREINLCPNSSLDLRLPKTKLDKLLFYKGKPKEIQISGFNFSDEHLKNVNWLYNQSFDFERGFIYFQVNFYNKLDEWNSLIMEKRLGQGLKVSADIGSESFEDSFENGVNQFLKKFEQNPQYITFFAHGK